MRKGVGNWGGGEDETQRKKLVSVGLKCTAERSNKAQRLLVVAQQERKKTRHFNSSSRTAIECKSGSKRGRMGAERRKEKWKKGREES